MASASFAKVRAVSSDKENEPTASAQKRRRQHFTFLYYFDLNTNDVYHDIMYYNIIKNELA